VTVLSLVLSHIIVSTLFIDTIFSFPGFGSIYYNAISALDYPVLLSTTAVITVSVSLANFLVDVLYAVIDPRVRYQGGGGS
jgi:peptide/nickel transport system permease protein